MIIVLPALVSLIGAIIYLVATPGPHSPKFAELGRIAYFVGLLWLIAIAAEHVVKFFPAR